MQRLSCRISLLAIAPLCGVEATNGYELPLPSQAAEEVTPLRESHELRPAMKPAIQ